MEPRKSGSDIERRVPTRICEGKLAKVKPKSLPHNGVEAELKYQRPLERARIPKGDTSPCRKWRKKLHPSQARCVDQAIEYEHGNGAPAPGEV